MAIGYTSTIGKSSTKSWYSKTKGITITGQVKKYATYQEMLDDPSPGNYASVIDASGDPTVEKGSAFYAYLGSGVWKKLYEEECMDVEVIVDDMRQEIEDLKQDIQDLEDTAAGTTFQFLRPNHQGNLHLHLDIYDDMELTQLLATMDSTHVQDREKMVVCLDDVFLAYPADGLPAKYAGRQISVLCGSVDRIDNAYIHWVWTTTSGEVVSSKTSVYPATASVAEPPPSAMNWNTL